MRNILRSAKQKIIPAASLGALVLFVASFAANESLADSGSGNGSGGGGDLLRISAEQMPLVKDDIFLRTSFVTNYIQDPTEGLKSDLIELVNRLTPQQVEFVASTLPENFKSVQSLLTSQKQKLVQDIEQSPWQLSETDVYAWCGDKDGMVKDAATCGFERSVVRFNYRRIAHYEISRSDLRKRLIQLAFHEHVRHFGFADNGNILAKLAGIVEKNDDLVTLHDSNNGLAPSRNRVLLSIVRAMQRLNIPTDGFLTKNAVGELPTKKLSATPLEYILDHFFSRDRRDEVTNEGSVRFVMSELCYSISDDLQTSGYELGSATYEQLFAVEFVKYLPNDPLTGNLFAFGRMAEHFDGSFGDFADRLAVLAKARPSK